MLSVKFDDIEMSDYITVLHGFTTFDGADFQPELKEIDGGNGSKFLYTRHGYKTIPMPFFVKKNLNDKYDVLEKILSVKEPKPLIFGNMPDRCFYAVPSSTLSFDEIIDFGKGTITWLVPDGLAHATTETPFPATLNSDGVLEATIVNDGTAEVPISYEITHNADNGYIGIVSAEGAMEFGKRDEVDGENYKQNERLLTSPTFANWTKTIDTSLENANNSANGALSSANNKITISSSNPGSGNTWHGGVLDYIFSPDSEGQLGSKNWYCYSEIIFESFIGGQTGAITLCFFDASQNVVFKVAISKSTKNGFDAVIQWGTANKLFESITFNAAKSNAANNPLADGKGYFDITKTGEKVEVFIFGKRYTGIDSAIKDAKVTGVQVFIGQFGVRGIDSTYVSLLYLKKLSFEKMNVDKWRDVPNRYAKGTIATIDGETKNFYVNGMPALDDEIVGTQYFKAPPGTSKVQFYFSDFSDPVPGITATIREAWL